MSRQAVSRQLSAGPDGAMCVICMDSLSASAELARPSVCQHRFCRPCLEQMCRENRRDTRCPLDRLSFSMYGVSTRESVREVMHEVESLQPLKRLFSSLVEPLVLGLVLLVVLWMAPTYTLALHIAATGAIYWYTGGMREWQPYISYAAVFYIILLPVLHIGLLETVYSWCCGFLLVRWVSQLPELQSSEVTPEKLLFLATAVLLLLVYPAVLFSAYTLLLAYGYALCLILSFALMATLNTLHGSSFAVYSFVFFSVLHAPYLCQLSDISLPCMAYYCAALLYLTVWHLPENGPARDHLPDPNLVIRLAGCIALSLVFQLSLWNALYTTVCVVHLTGVKSFMDTDRGKLLMQRVPLLMWVYLATIQFALPWKLFGFTSLLGCSIVVLCANVLVVHLIRRFTDHASQAGNAIMCIYQFIILGILLPALLF